MNRQNEVLFGYLRGQEEAGARVPTRQAADGLQVATCLFLPAEVTEEYLILSVHSDHCPLLVVLAACRKPSTAGPEAGPASEWRTKLNKARGEMGASVAEEDPGLHSCITKHGEVHLLVNAD